MNFKTLAESVALDPMGNFWTSLDIGSVLEYVGLNLFAVALLFILLELQASAYIRNKILINQ